jgi:hypothetical protein
VVIKDRLSVNKEMAKQERSSSCKTVIVLQDEDALGMTGKQGLGTLRPVAVIVCLKVSAFTLFLSQ